MTSSHTSPQSRSRITRPYLPPQHGAWAFLALPLALGTLVAPATPLLIVLAIAWIAAYPLSYATLGLVSSRRPRRFRRPAAAWAALVAPAAAVLVIAQPWLIGVGAAYLALFAINITYARRRDERALVNDLVFIVECSAMVPVVWAVGAASQNPSTMPDGPVPLQVWILTAMCALVLISSTLHVKSLIRERTNPRYARLSKQFALACLPVALLLAAAWGVPTGLWLMVPFVVMAARALRPMVAQQRPGVIGLIELGCFVTTAVAATFAVVL